MPAKDRLELIDVTRGLAALAVTWGHIVLNNPRVVVNDTAQAILHGSAAYGYLGVYAFYVVSGYVIPLALMRGNYRLSMFGRFIAKRLVRLQPPYYLSLILALAVAAAATFVPSYAGIPFQIDPKSLALHLIYLPSVAGYEWINPVYWSLLVEVEYYLAIGLAMPLLMRISGIKLAAVLVAACCIPFLLTGFAHLPYHLPFFIVGLTLSFQSRERLTTLQGSVTLVVAVGLIAIQRGPEYAVAAMATLPFLLLRAGAPKFLISLGTISYSLYLVHYVIGWRGLRAFLRFADSDPERILAYLAAAVLSIATAIVFYLLVERPSLRWASKIKLTGRLRPAVDGTLVAPAP